MDSNISLKSVLCLQSTAHILASDGVMKKAVTGVTAPSFCPKHAYKMRINSMFHYWQACISKTKSMDRWHSSLDGVTVSGEHTVPFLHFTPQNELLTFGPPQVNGQIDIHHHKAPAQEDTKVGVQLKVEHQLERVQLLGVVPPLPC